MTINMTENGEENDNAGDCRVVGRHGGVSMVVGVAFERGWFYKTFIIW